MNSGKLIYIKSYTVYFTSKCLGDMPQLNLPMDNTFMIQIGNIADWSNKTISAEIFVMSSKNNNLI